MDQIIIIKSTIIQKSQCLCAWWMNSLRPKEHIEKDHCIVYSCIVCEYTGLNDKSSYIMKCPIPFSLWYHGIYE